MGNKLGPEYVKDEDRGEDDRADDELKKQKMEPVEVLQDDVVDMNSVRRYLSQEERQGHPPPSVRNPWCVRFPTSVKKEDTAQFRLFCFSHGGGNSSSFSQWDSMIFPSISMVCMELPGRQSRFNEKVLSDVHVIVSQFVTQGMIPYLDRPFFLFGHSFGASIAFEVATYLQKEYNISPLCLFISSQEAPQNIKSAEPPISQRTDQEIIKYLTTAYPDSHLRSVVHHYPDLVEMMMPALRGDFQALENYVCTSTTPLKCAIKVYHGEEETFPSQIRDWMIHTPFKSHFSIHRFEGGHFYLNTAVTVLRLLNSHITQYSTAYQNSTYPIPVSLPTPNLKHSLEVNIEK